METKTGYNTEVMTVHKALATLKILNDRIAKATSELCVCEAVPTSQSLTPESNKFRTSGKAGVTSLLDMISRYNAIKSAIIVSNATTEVTVVNKTMKVAELIEMKEHYLRFMKTLGATIAQQYSNAVSAKNRMDVSAQDRALSFSGLRNSNDLVQGTDAYEAYKTFFDNNCGAVVEAIDCKNSLEKINALLDEFMADADAALSTSNAITTLTIEYKIGEEL